jgi:signal transduction histidine kinase
MIELTRTRKDVERAWHAFLAEGELPAFVRPEIRRSWRRVRGELHVDPGLRTCPGIGDGALARAGSEGVLGVASRLVSRFAERLAPDGHVVAYFDRDGVMLARDGHRATRRRLDGVNFAPGACWAEHAAGTNGPGTALAEGKPVEVFAAEHFVEAFQPWTCASVPVRFGGRVVGVVDITSPWTARHPSLLLTAEAIAQAIGSELEAGAARQESALLLEVARDALQARDDFLSVASHELKTPLTPLRLGLQQVARLLSRDGSVDPGRVAGALRGADVHVGRLVKAIDDLLDGSRAAREPIRLAREPVDLGLLVRRVVGRLGPEIERQACRVRVDAAPDVVGRWDEAHVERALDHLLANAMRYAPGEIDVGVRSGRRTALVRVRDRGPGIAPADQERIFLPFERAVSCRHSSGFGLGLHAVRRIAEAHGGAIRVESAPGAGSTFELELPLDAGGPASNA